jgi:hypothetical protein
VNHLLREVLPALGLDEPYAAAHLDLASGGALPAALPVGTLAVGSVAAAALAGAALRGAGRVQVDPRQVAVSFRGDQVLTVDGRGEPGLAPLSGFFEASDGERPAALPAQALDHATGYLLAAGVLAALRRRAERGGTWRVAAHLARTAHWLLQTDALDGPATPVDDLTPWVSASETELGRIVQSRPAFAVEGVPARFGWTGRPWGTDEAEWAGAGPGPRPAVGTAGG